MPLSDNELLPGQIRFYDSCLPSLQAGDYHITADQTVVDDHGKQLPISPLKQTFTVVGPRFALQPDDVYAVYPPANSRGDFSTTFPHIVLARRSIPWERILPHEHPKGGTDFQPPWVALLLFDEKELKDELEQEIHDKRVASLDACNETLARSLKVSGFLQPEEKDVRVPKIDIRDLTHEEQEMNCFVIDIPAGVFNAITPALDELAYLAHARQVNTEHKEILGLDRDGWFSVVMGNRLPNPNGKNIAHLVSLEGLADCLRPGSVSSEYKIVRLVSLASWNFTGVPSAGNFMHLMNNVAKNAGLLRMPSGEPDNSRLILSFEANPTTIKLGGTTVLSWQTKDAQACTLDPGNFPVSAGMPEYPIKPQKTTTYTLTATAPDGQKAQSRIEVIVEPDDAQQLLSERLADGYILLDHLDRQGKRSYAWYRGPLAPSARPQNASQGLYQTANQAVIDDPAAGFPDQSYAVAWQIGRLLALADGGFSLALLNWRRQDHQRINSLDNRQRLFSDYAETLGAPQVLSEMSATPQAEMLPQNLPAQLVTNFLKTQLGPALTPGGVGVKPLIRASAPSGLHRPDPLPGLLSPGDVNDILAAGLEPMFDLFTRLFGSTGKEG
jgi:hypothetical protein